MFNRFVLALCVFLVSMNAFGNVVDDLIIKKNPSANNALINLIAAGLDENTENDNSRLGKQICEAGNRPSYECIGATTVAKGICLASGRPSYECVGASTIGKGICLAGGRPSYECIGATTVAKGICLSGGIPSYECISATTIGKAICLAGGEPSYECIGASSAAKGVCLAGGVPSYKCISATTVYEAIKLIPFEDRNFWWDKFRDQYGNEQWRCRGAQTKRFADNYKCSKVSKDDDRWPKT